MGHNCIISHQSAHGAAADTGIFPLWFCSEMRIDQRFQLIDHPLHKDFARSMNPLSVKIPEIIGRKLLQTLVALMIAFNTDNDQLVLPLPHKFLQSPGFTGKSWGLQEFMRQWENQLIIVGIECNHEGNKRLEEFSPYDFRDFDGQRIHGTGKVFMQWVVDELKPLIDTHFRTKPEREYTGIGGSSMGGLMAYYTVVAHNDVFSKAACISSAVGFCYDAMREELTSAGPLLPDTRVYMSWGSKESGRKPGLVKYTCTNLEFSHLLVERGAVTYPYLQAFGGHCEADWEKQNAIYMPFLWNGVFEDGME